MKLTDALLGEHAIIYSLFDHLESLFEQTEDLGELKRLSGLLAAAVASHAEVEDDLLFPALEAHVGHGGPLAAMRQEHEAIEASLKAIQRATSLDDAKTKLDDLIDTACDHFAKEEEFVFPLAERTLTEGDLDQLGARWMDMRL